MRVLYLEDLSARYEVTIPIKQAPTDDTITILWDLHRNILDVLSEV